MIGWACIYNFAAIIHQGTKENTDAAVLKTKLSLNWIGSIKIIAVGSVPASDTLDNRVLHRKILFLDIACHPIRWDGTPTVASPWIGTNLTGIPTTRATCPYMLSLFSTKSPPYHVIVERRLLMAP